MLPNAMTEPIPETPFVEGIRKRPAMYVGSTELFGFINYLVCPIAMLLANGAKRISVTIDDAINVTADTPIPIEAIDGRISPFEQIQSGVPGHSFEGTVLNALSKELAVTVVTSASTHELHYQQGKRIRDNIVQAGGSVGTFMRFVPDASIFTVTSVSSAIFESYFRRLSFLHAGVSFLFTTASETKTFCAENGLSDLFTAVSSPYQIMHAPIQVTGIDGALTMKLVMAYHSWSEDRLWCFINNGRAVQGGTHETGLRRALTRLRKQLSRPNKIGNGVVAVVSFQYPHAVWEGCIKSKIGNPELEWMVYRLVVDRTVEWVHGHPDVEKQIQDLQIFQFPEGWSS